MNKNLKDYIGDSVYVEFDGYNLIMTTQNGLPGDPSNEIILGIPEIEKLLRFVERFRIQANKQPKGSIENE